MKRWAHYSGAPSLVFQQEAFVQGILVRAFLFFPFLAMGVQAEPSRPEEALKALENAPRGQFFGEAVERLKAGGNSAAYDRKSKAKSRECTYDFVEVPEGPIRTLPQLGDYAVTFYSKTLSHGYYHVLGKLRVYSEEDFDPTTEKGIKLLWDKVYQEKLLVAHFSPIEIGYFLMGGSEGLKEAYDQFKNHGGPNPLDRLYREAYEVLALIGSSKEFSRYLQNSHTLCEDEKLRKKIRAREIRLGELLETLFKNVPRAAQDGHYWESPVATLQHTSGIEKVTIQEFAWDSTQFRVPAQPIGEPKVFYVPAGASKSALNYLSSKYDRTLRNGQPRYELKVEEVFSETATNTEKALVLQPD